MRGSLVHAAQLTNSEAAILNGLASSCNGAYSAESTSGSATVKQLMHQYPATVAGAPTEIAPQIAALEAQRQQIITACTASLQSQMGTPRFQMLYNFVSSTEGPRIKPAMPSAPPSGTIHPPPPPGTTTQ
jgi:hypothetical protein